MSSLRRKALKTFQLQGLTVRADALKFLLETLEASSDPEQALSECISRIDKQTLANGVVDLAVIKHSTSVLAVDPTSESATHRLATLSAFDFPRWVWRHNRKQWWAASDIEQAGGSRSSSSAAASTAASTSSKSSKPRLFGTGADKASALTQRYEMLLRRLLQHEEFRAPVVSGLGEGRGAAAAAGAQGAGHGEANEELEESVHKVHTVDGLIGTGTGQKTVLGALVQLQEEKWTLEDPHACVEVDLSQSVFTMGCFPEGVVVLVDGHYDAQRSVFVADFVGFPPPEPRVQSLRQFHSSSSVGGTGGALDWFGLPIPPRLVPQLQEFLVEESDSSMVMLSDVWLDRLETFTKLETLLNGLELMDPAPVALVLMGDFSSKAFGSDRHDSILFRERFDKLGSMLARSHALKKAQVVVVPGPGDPSLGPAVCLPRPQIPQSLTRGLRRWLGERVHLLSNPARIRYCTVAITLFRENLVTSLYRHSIRPPISRVADSDRVVDRNQNVVKTLLDQAHLCPLSLGVRPIFWPMDYSLWLYPLPDVLVLGDRYQQYSTRYEDCLCMNPGSFGMDSTFLLFYPYHEETQKPHPEFCSLDEFSTLDLSAATSMDQESDEEEQQDKSTSSEQQQAHLAKMKTTSQRQKQQHLVSEEAAAEENDDDEAVYEEPHIEDVNEDELEVARRAQRLEAGLAGADERVPDEDGSEYDADEVVIGQDKLQPADGGSAAELDAGHDDEWEWEEVEEEVEVEVEVTDSEAEEEVEADEQGEAEQEEADDETNEEEGASMVHGAEGEKADDDDEQDRTQNADEMLLDEDNDESSQNTQPDYAQRTQTEFDAPSLTTASVGEVVLAQSMASEHADQDLDPDQVMVDASTAETQQDSLAFHVPSSSLS